MKLRYKHNQITCARRRHQPPSPSPPAPSADSRAELLLAGARAVRARPGGALWFGVNHLLFCAISPPAERPPQTPRSSPGSQAEDRLSNQHWARPHSECFREKPHSCLPGTPAPSRPGPSVPTQLML